MEESARTSRSSLHEKVKAAMPWLLPHGLFVALQVWYGMGAYWVGDTDGHWYSIVPAYAVAGLLACLVLAWVVPSCKQRVEQFQVSTRWLDEAGTGAPRSRWGYGLVAFVMIVSQFPLLFVLRPHDSLIWLGCFALIGGVLATAGAYFFIGDPGMVDLRRLDAWIDGQEGGGHRSESIPRLVQAGLEAELAMLRIMVSAFVSLYVVAIVGLVFSLDKVPQLFGHDKLSAVPRPTLFWFFSGVALLLVECHFWVTAVVHGRHAAIARWLQRAGRPRGGQVER